MSIRFACSRSEFKSWISLLIFCLVDLCIIDSGVLKLPTIILWESKSLCKSLRTCLIYLGAPVLGPYIFTIVSSSCCIDPFNHVMTFFVFFDLCCLKVYFIREDNCNSCRFLLSICSINLLHPFILSLCVSFHVRWVSWIQHTDGFWFFIQFASLCLLIGAFSPFTFRVNIVMCKFDTAILMLADCFAC